MDLAKVKRKIQTALPDITDRELEFQHLLRHSQNYARAFLYILNKHLEKQAFITTREVSISMNWSYSYTFQVIERLEPYCLKKSPKRQHGRYRYYILSDWVKKEVYVQSAMKCLGLD